MTAHERWCAQAWCRVDLAGGTLDIWPLGLLHPGARTVNVAIDLAVSVTLARSDDGSFRVRQDGEEVVARTAAELAGSPATALPGLALEALELGPVTVEIESGSPRGAGLGASSALVMALIAAGEAAAGRESTVAARAALARDLEARLMGLPTGRQDHFPAALGGALEICHRPGGELVRRLAVDLEALTASLVVAYTGTSHFSAATNWQIIRRRLEAEPATVERLSGIAETASELSAALEAGELERVAALMSREWRHRRRLAEGVSTPEIEASLGAAIAAGAWGGKACGAGAGGCVALLAPPARRAAVERQLEQEGCSVLATAPAGAPMAVRRLS